MLRIKYISGIQTGAWQERGQRLIAINETEPLNLCKLQQEWFHRNIGDIAIVGEFLENLTSRGLFFPPNLQLVKFDSKNNPLQRVFL